MSYNQKLDRFAEAQQNFRAIATQRSGCHCSPPPNWDLLNIETIVVKPEWLVGTFAFNPMLGFRRRLQAASIAHGCAATLIELRKRQMQNPQWTANWGVSGELGFNGEYCVNAEDLEPLKRSKEDQRRGKCWFRDAICPFSRAAAGRLPKGGRPSEDTVDEVEEIYRLCGNRHTHHPDAPKKL